MGNNNFYPEFVADQVLTANHLNELFNYLDEQNRFTRTTLIGIGIACGLDTTYDGNTINITKGVGVTSKGYLIQYDAASYNYYRPYKLPESLKSLAPYKDFDMQQLVSLQPADVKVGDSDIKSNAAFLNTHAVVLFIENNGEDLKNCTTNDCDDKGKKVTCTVRALLIKKSDLTAFGWANFEAAKLALPDIILRRYNVPFKQLKSATEVLTSFHEITTADVLKQIAAAYSAAYNAFNIVLKGGGDPFSELYERLSKYFAAIKKKEVIYSQYFYDLIDDLIKAYYEFREVGNDLITECCPDESLFPCHLTLSEATGSSTAGVSTYRNYFIYSPLFNDQKNRLAELKLLFRRMRYMAERFDLPTLAEATNVPVKITPSNLGSLQLSKRAIPYYYGLSTLHKYWSYEKTRIGKEKQNLSYNSDKYNIPILDFVKNPLLYEIEKYNFFRIEGHVGKDYRVALKTIISDRDRFNLPFDVIALNVRPSEGGISAKDYTCCFEDLETLYEVLVTELMCKVRHSVSEISNIKTDKMKPGAAAPSAPAPAAPAAAAPTTKEKEAETKARAKKVIETNKRKTYKKGTYVEEFAKPEEETIGKEYMVAIADKGVVAKPAVTETAYTNKDIYNQYLKAHYLYFLDTLEELLSSVLPDDLADFDSEKFEVKYALFLEEAEELAMYIYRAISDKDATGSPTAGTSPIIFIVNELMMLQTLCMDDRLAALKAEMAKRLETLQLQQLFSTYSGKHPGLEHKAGVPKGGTFILVYTENTVKSEEEVADEKEAEKDTKTRTKSKNDPDDLLEIIKQYKEKNKDGLSDRDMKDISDLEKSFESRSEERKDIKVAERIVFADFYLPYLCCGDCGTVSYVFKDVKPDPVIITTQPASTTICEKNNATFTVAASAAAVTYQWQVNTGAGFVNLKDEGGYTGSATNTLNIAAAPLTMNGYKYICIVTDGVTTATSGEALLTVNAGVAITTQPLNTTAFTGKEAAFTLAATGAGLTYQWQVAGAGAGFQNIADQDIYSGATTGVLNIKTASESMNGLQYRCIVTGTCPPAITSDVATLTVNTKIEITKQPTSTTICSGSNTTFGIEATGTTTKYKWQVTTDGTNFSNITDGVVYSGATTKILALTAVPVAFQGNKYRCVVSSGTTTVNSSEAALTVNESPVITAQPVNTIAVAGNAASFAITATGAGITYQWQINPGSGFANITDLATYSGVNTPTLNINNVLASMNNFTYRCIITGQCLPQLISTIVSLKVTTVITISQQPANASVCEANSAIFRVSASGSQLSFQWQLNGVNITNTQSSGVNTNTLTIAGATLEMNNGRYRCVISDGISTVNSTEATLTVHEVARIMVQPKNSVICEGNDAVLTVTTTGSNVQYQWQVSTGNSIFTDIVGQVSNTLNLKSGSFKNGFQFRCLVGNPCTARLTTDVASVTVVSANPSFNMKIQPGTNGSTCVLTALEQNLKSASWVIDAFKGPTPFQIKIDKNLGSFPADTIVNIMEGSVTGSITYTVSEKVNGCSRSVAFVITKDIATKVVRAGTVGVNLPG